jgi:hypothetical protein
MVSRHGSDPTRSKRFVGWGMGDGWLMGWKWGVRWGANTHRRVRDFTHH